MLDKFLKVRDNGISSDLTEQNHSSSGSAAGKKVIMTSKTTSSFDHGVELTGIDFSKVYEGMETGDKRKHTLAANAVVDAWNVSQADRASKLAGILEFAETMFADDPEQRLLAMAAAKEKYAAPKLPDIVAQAIAWQNKAGASSGSSGQTSPATRAKLVVDSFTFSGAKELHTLLAKYMAELDKAVGAVVTPNELEQLSRSYRLIPAKSGWSIAAKYTAIRSSAAGSVLAPDSTLPVTQAFAGALPGDVIAWSDDYASFELRRGEKVLKTVPGLRENGEPLSANQAGNALVVGFGGTGKIATSRYTDYTAADLIDSDAWFDRVAELASDAEETSDAAAVLAAAK